MKLNELRELKIEDLKKELNKQQEELNSIRLDLVKSDTKEYSKLRKTKKLLAQINTIIREKELLNG
jgi:ribosomal protein L29